MQYQAKDLFQLQSELIDTKVDMAVSNAIKSVVEQIVELRNEMRNDMHRLENKIQAEVHGLRDDMNHRFSTLENDVTAIKTRLGMSNETRQALRSRILDYAFKAGWVAGTLIFAYLIANFHQLIH